MNMTDMEPEDRPCFDRGNGSPFCSPLSTDTWYQGSTHEFIWNYNHPFYVDVELINLFLYYQENYAFRAVRNWTDIDRAEGSLQVKIDSTWFPTDLSPDTVNRTWTLYGFYLPTELDPTTELVNPYSQYPRPFNFSVVQLFHTETKHDTPSSVVPLPTTTSVTPLQTWVILLIISLGLILLAGLAAALLWLIRRRRPQRTNRLSPSQTLVSETFGNEKHQAKDFAFYQEAMLRDRQSSMFTLNSDAIRLAGSFRSIVQGAATEEERRRLGKELLERQLAEEGASVKHAERRPTRVHSIIGCEEKAILEHSSFTELPPK